MYSQAISDIETLRAAIRQGYQPAYVFFWGHTPHKEGQVDKACLSQWWPVSFDVDGVTYLSAEQYMMAEKARLFGDEVTRKKILQADAPDVVKKLGKEVQPFDFKTWEKHRTSVVVRGNLAKFGQNPALKAFLLGTGERVLVEASPYDKIWGIGLQADDPRAADPQQWQGLNLLGFALMAVRSQLQGATGGGGEGAHPPEPAVSDGEKEPELPGGFCMMMTTTGSREEAGRIAELLVSRKLAACVQIVSIASVYTWEGQLNKDDEYLLLIKTAAGRYPAVEAAILEIHSYQVPEIIQLPITQGLDGYLGWIAANTRDE